MLRAGDVWRLDRIQLDEIPKNHHEDGVICMYFRVTKQSDSHCTMYTNCHPHTLNHHLS